MGWGVNGCSVGPGTQMEEVHVPCRRGLPRQATYRQGMELPMHTAFNRNKRKHRADFGLNMPCISHDNADAIPDKTAGSDYILLANSQPTDHMPLTDHNEVDSTRSAHFMKVHQ